MKKTERFYLDCPYSEKDECKAQGAYWDADRRKWYVPEGVEVNDFKKWWPGESSKLQEQSTNNDGKRFYLNVGFSDKDLAKFPRCSMGRRCETMVHTKQLRQK